MRAQQGDRIVIPGRHVGDKTREGEVLGAEHADGSPPYRVRWSDTGQEGLFFPGPDAHVEHRSAAE